MDLIGEDEKEKMGSLSLGCIAEITVAITHTGLQLPIFKDDSKINLCQIVTVLLSGFHLVLLQEQI